MRTKRTLWTTAGFVAACGLAAMLIAAPALGAPAKPTPNPEPEFEYPPKLPGDKLIDTATGPQLLVAPGYCKLREGVEIAKTAPVVDFAYYAGQDHKGKPWSVWGDGCAVGDKYYSAIGDHLSPRGTAQVYEYDSTAKTLRMLVDLKTFLESNNLIPEGMDYTPGKIHSRILMGKDGWLYYSTHRGSASTTNDAHGYKGDWILRTNPASGVTEVAAAQPIPKHVIPASILDPDRLIYYGGTQSGKDAEIKAVAFFAYDCVNRKLLFQTTEPGMSRYGFYSPTTGCAYWNGHKYDPETNEMSACKAPSVRSATTETPQGWVYGTTGHSVEIWAYNPSTDEYKVLGDGGVAGSTYTTTMDASPDGRYLYYIPGGHGGGGRDGTPIVQYDTKTNTRKVLCFLWDFCKDKWRYCPDGTFGSALSPDGTKLYITWNGQRVPATKWESCAMTVIHIPESERQP